VEARLAAADGIAEELAKETAAELLAAQGDANRNEERKQRVLDVIEGD
jgi:hypothetical protein